MANFIHTIGTAGVSSTKRLVTWTTGLTGLGSGIHSVSDATADTGIFKQTSFSNCQYGMAYFTVITASFTPTAGGGLSFWWSPSTDDGTTFEAVGNTTPSATVPAVARPPDFIIPLYVGATTLAVNSIWFAQGLIPLPYVASHLVLQNNSGVAFATGVHTVNVYGVADTFA